MNFGHRKGVEVNAESANRPGRFLPALTHPILKLISPVRWTGWHWLVAGAWLLGIFAVQWKLGLGFSGGPNADVNRNDQSAYLRLVADNIGYWWPTATDGIRNPLLPFLLKPWHSSEVLLFFEKAKVVNVVFGLLATLAFALYWFRHFAFLPALNLCTLTAIAVTLPSSTWVGAEALFYVGFFFLWVLFGALLVANPLWKYALAGALAGLTYLAKPSITLLVGAFFGLSVLKACWCVWHPDSTRPWSPRRLIAGTSLYAAITMAVILPRAVYSAKHFGNPFQNTAHACMWFDDWPAAYARLSDLNPRRINNLLPAERPTASNFLKRNSLAAIWQRFAKGVNRQWHNLLLPEGTLKNGRKLQVPALRLPLRVRGAYLMLFAGLAVAMSVGPHSRDPSKQRQRRAMLILTGTAFATHFAAFSFYTPIAGGSRFIMALFLPVLASLAWVSESQRPSLASDGAKWSTWTYIGFHLGLGSVMIWHLAWLSTVRQFGELRGAF